MDASFKAEFNTKAMAQQVYEQLRKAICSGNVFKAGEKINFDLLSQEWNVSKPPIREALKALEQEGFIQYIPRRGFFITSLSQKDLKDLIDIRLALETHALSKGFDNLERETLKQILADFHSTYKHLNETGDVTPYLDVDERFHAYIVKSSMNRRMTELYTNMQGAMNCLHIRDTFFDEAEMGVTLPGHVAVINAILYDDREEAARLLRCHLNNVEKRLLDHQRELVR